MVTNGGGIPDAQRRALLSDELGVDVAPTQLVQSHTPLRHKLAEKFKEEAVLVLGGKDDACRQVAHSCVSPFFAGETLHDAS